MDQNQREERSGAGADRRLHARHRQCDQPHRPCAEWVEDPDKEMETIRKEAEESEAEISDMFPKKKDPDNPGDEG